MNINDLEPSEESAKEMLAFLKSVHEGRLKLLTILCIEACMYNIQKQQKKAAQQRGAMPDIEVTNLDQAQDILSRFRTGGAL